MNISKAILHKQHRKTLAVISASAMLVGTAFVSGVPTYTGVNTDVYALETVESDAGKFEYYTLSDGTVKITDYYSEDKNAVIPSEIDGKTVSSIDIDPFCSISNKLVIPYGVKTIKNIGDCVASVTVDENNQYFSSQDGTLFNKDKTELIKFFDYECEKYVVPDGVTSIADNAFENMYSLHEIVLPDSLKSIGKDAFDLCDKLSKIENLDNVEYVGEGAFASTPWYENQPDGIVYVGKTLFDYKGEMPKNTSVSVNEGTKSITSNAFSLCDGLVSLSIPESVENIGESIVDGCKNLAKITVDENNKNYSSQDGILFDKEKTQLLVYPKAKKGEYNIPDSVTEIGESSFAGCKYITSVNIPDGVTKIGSYAFAYCEHLTGINIPDGVKSIGGSAFFGCTSLSDISIPDSVEIIGGYAFSDTKWYDEFYEKQPDGALYIGHTLYSYKGEKPEFGSLVIEDPLVIKDGTTSIADSVFYGCEELSSVTIPDGVKSIGDNAFFSTSLKSVTIPASVDYIGDHAFGYYYFEAADTDFGVYYSLDSSFVIKGQKGTVAEAYADDNNITFVLAGSEGEQSAESSVQSTESKESSVSNSKTDNVPTGDSTLPFIIVAILVVSGGITATVLFRNKLKKNEQ